MSTATDEKVNDLARPVTPVGKRVLIEQRMDKRETALLHDNSSKAGEDTGYDVSFKVLAIGEECPKDGPVQVGVSPILGKHAKEEAVKVVEGKMGDKVVIMHLIMFYDDIVALD